MSTDLEATEPQPIGPTIAEMVERLRAKAAPPGPKFCAECGGETRRVAWNELCERCDQEHRQREQAEEEARQLQAFKELTVDRLIPPRYREARLDNDAVAQWVQSVVRDEGESLLLTGPVGVGKTWTMYAAARALAEAGYGVTWRHEGDYQRASVVRLLSELRPGGGRERLDDLIGAKLLLLDDLGAERPSEWAQERLYELINERYEQMAPSIVTTNLPPKELAGVIGDRIASRLAEMCRVVVLKGRDRRRKPS